jgi:hypothetical protein
MKNRVKFAAFAVALLITILISTVVKAEDKVNSESCTYKDLKLYGKVQIVDSSPDLKVKQVDAFADLHVQRVDAFPDACGKWQIVDDFPDFKVQFVDSFPDFKVKFVDAFPGVTE